MACAESCVSSAKRQVRDDTVLSYLTRGHLSHLSQGPRPRTQEVPNERAAVSSQSTRQRMRSCPSRHVTSWKLVTCSMGTFSSSSMA